MDTIYNEDEELQREDGHGGLVGLGQVERHWRERSIEVS